MGKRIIITESEKKNILSSHVKFGYVPTLSEDEIRRTLSFIFESEEPYEKLKEKLESTISDNFDEDPKKFTKNIIDDIPTLKGKEKEVENSIKNATEIKTTRNGIIAVVAALLIGIFANEFKFSGKSKNTKSDSDLESTKTELPVDSDLRQYDLDGDGHLDDYEIDKAARYKTDSIINSVKLGIYTDKQIKSDQESGIEIKNIKFPKASEYSDYDAIKFSYKNNTGKNIEAISFSWYDLKDVFGDPVDPLYKGGYDSDGLRKGATGYGQWDIMERKVKTGKVYVSKIAFTDGTVWKNE